MSECSEQIASREYLDVILRYRNDLKELSEFDSTCITEINSTWAVVNYPIEYINNYNIEETGYFRIPKLYAVTDVSSQEASGVDKTLNNPLLDIDGRNVIIGIIDTGIDYTHPAFMKDEGKTRIISVWDQNVTGNNPPERIGYGNIYTQNEINNAINSENPFSLVPGDENGHGTFLAGVAAGNDRKSNYYGSAPKADLVIVKLREAKPYLKEYYLVENKSTVYSEVDIMFGVKYLYETAARLSKPLVILVGIGSGFGPHTTATPLGEYLKEVANQYGVVVVTSSGNEGTLRRHYSYKIRDNEQKDVEISVGTGVEGFVTELWADNPDILTIGMTSPLGEIVPRIPLDIYNNTKIQFIYGETRAEVDYRIVEEISGKYLIFIRLIKPTQGIWKISVYGSNIVFGNFNMWLPMREMLDKEVYFLESNPDITVTQVGSARELITVSAYDHINDSYYPESGRGYSADNVVKPEICAPGVNVYGPVPGKLGYGRRSGTSVAAAHTAGCAALLLQWGQNSQRYKYISTANVKNLLIKGARRDNRVTYPNNTEGYGRLDIYSVFESLKIR